MKNAIIGTFYKDPKSAQKKKEEKNRLWKQDTFTILGAINGYFVVSKKQLTQSK